MSTCILARVAMGHRHTLEGNATFAASGLTVIRQTGQVQPVNVIMTGNSLDRHGTLHMDRRRLYLRPEVCNIQGESSLTKHCSEGTSAVFCQIICFYF